MTICYCNRTYGNVLSLVAGDESNLRAWKHSTWQSVLALFPGICCSYGGANKSRKVWPISHNKRWQAMEMRVVSVARFFVCVCVREWGGGFQCIRHTGALDHIIPTGHDICSLCWVDAVGTALLPNSHPASPMYNTHFPRCTPSPPPSSHTHCPPHTLIIKPKSLLQSVLRNAVRSGI